MNGFDEGNLKKYNLGVNMGDCIFSCCFILKNLGSVCFLLRKCNVDYGLGKIFWNKGKVINYIKVCKSDVVGVYRE